MYALHLALVLGIGSKLKFKLEELLVASNANIGGSATASALAIGKKWTSLIVPGVLVGNFGVVIATFLGLALYAIASSWFHWIVGRYTFVIFLLA